MTNQERIDFYKNQIQGYENLLLKCKETIETREKIDIEKMNIFVEETKTDIKELEEKIGILKQKIEEEENIIKSYFNFKE